RPRILIGGLGLGFTLRRVLETTGDGARIDVVELIPAVIDWNRTHLRQLNGECLDDPRVSVIEGDVAKVIEKAAPETWDAILLDVDNGPVAMVHRGNARLYSSSGITRIMRVLRPGGRLAVWSAGISEGFEKRLTGWGLSVKTVRAKLHPGAKSHGCLIYVADKAD
ncbi:MAG: spermine synthase, partial [Verrucomicrobia bacterium]